MDRRRYHDLVAEEWPALHRAWLERWEFPYVAPPAVRQKIEDDLWPRFRKQPYDLAEVSDSLALQAEFREKALQLLPLYAQNHVRSEMDKLRALMSAPLPSVDVQLYRSEETRQTKLVRVAFVAERALPFSNLLRGELRRGHRGPRDGTPWGALLDAWHREGGKAKSPGALKKAYNRDTQGDPPAQTGGLCRELVQQVRAEVRTCWAWRAAHLGPHPPSGTQDDPLPPLLRRLAAAEVERERRLREYARLTPEQQAQQDAEARVRANAFWAEYRAELERHPAPSPPLHFERYRREDLWLKLYGGPPWEVLEAEMPESEREQIWRDAVTREELVSERVYRLIFLTQSAEGRDRLLRAPLRDWFIAEARGGHMQLHRQLWHLHPWSGPTESPDWAQPTDP